MRKKRIFLESNWKCENDIVTNFSYAMAKTRNYKYKWSITLYNIDSTRWVVIVLYHWKKGLCVDMSLTWRDRTEKRKMNGCGCCSLTIYTRGVYILARGDVQSLYDLQWCHVDIRINKTKNEKCFLPSNLNPNEPYLLKL